MQQQIDTGSVISSVRTARFLICAADRMTLFQTHAIGGATNMAKKQAIFRLRNKRLT